MPKEFNFKAQEMTTRELLAEMERLDFKPEFLERYRGYFVESDFVKFAHVSPGQDKVENVDLRTRQIILDPDKRVIRQPPPEAAAPENAGGEDGTAASPAEPPAAGSGSEPRKA